MSSNYNKTIIGNFIKYCNICFSIMIYCNIEVFAEWLFKSRFYFLTYVTVWKRCKEWFIYQYIPVADYIRIQWRIIKPRSKTFFIKIICDDNLATNTDYLIGLTLGIILNIFGVLKPIVWFSDKNTTYIFEQRNLLLKDRKSNIH